MKPNERTFSNLLSIIVTLEDSTIFQEELRLLTESMYSGKEMNYDTVLARRVRQPVAVALKADVKASGLQLEDFLGQAEAYFQELEVVELSIGFEPTAEQISLLAIKARELSGKALLLSLTYKPYIIGGAEIAYHGEYRDYSLRTKLNQLFVQMSQTRMQTQVTQSKAKAVAAT